MDVCFDCCVLSGRGLCDGFITHPEEVLPTVVCRCVLSRNLENEEAKARCWAVKIQPQWVVTPGKQTNKQTLIQNFVKICPVAAELFHADRRRDKHAEANCRLSQFFEGT
jgi:hypothetical protein